MACYKPVTAWRHPEGGALSFSERKEYREITIKCGQCIGCRLEKREAWTLRCIAESKMHAENSFITLTYDEAHYPQYGSLNYEHFQLFLKRLRRKVVRYEKRLVEVKPGIYKEKSVPVNPIRYFMCGEYGENLERPHYHALLFGFGFPDRVRCNSIRSAHPIFRSPLLEELWDKGFSSIGELNEATARYCCAYAVKKVTGDLADDHYSRVDISTGQIVSVEPEFVCMSLKPGIGETWLKRFWTDLYNVHDAMVVNGKKHKIPKYFDRQMDKIKPMLMDSIEFERTKRAEVHLENNTRERLEVREQVEAARLAFNNERRNKFSEI